MLLKLRPTAARARPLARRSLSAQSGAAPKPQPSAPAQAPPSAPSPSPPGAKKPSAAADESSTGSALPKLLLALALSAPAGAAVYVKQNPEWNPEALRDNANWVKFRELVLGPEATKASVPEHRLALPSQRKPAAKTPLQTVEEFSAAINKGQESASAPVAKKSDKPAKQVKETPAKKENAVVKKEAAKKDESQVVQAVKSAKKTVEKTVKEAEKKVEQVIKDAEKEVKEAPAKIKKEVAAVAHKAEEQVKKVEKEVKQEVAKVTAAVVAAEESFEKKVDAATDKARQEIAKLANQAKPQELSAQIDKQIQSTTNDILANLKSESDAAAADVETIYLKGIETLDSHALSIRVAQLATEMKHRSKWEAVRLLEALRRMEEETQQKSAEVLRRQDELHKELLARELRLQEEILTRDAREEMQALKKAYSEDLARNINEQRTSMLTNFQRTFEREKKAIEERHAQALRAKSLQYQNTLTAERKARAAELESYQAQLRALGTVLDSSSTYEAFSHQVHKTSVAALALSDRIEAAAPLRSEIRALREAARNDPFIEVAVKSLPASAVEEGAPSVSQLQERFAVVKSVSRRAALIPENSGIVGQLFGGALSYLVIPPGGPIEGTDTDAVLSRAEFALKAGDIENAVQEMKGLSGLPAEVSKDWVTAAETRLAVEQTAKVVKAHVALLAASLS